MVWLIAALFGALVVFFLWFPLRRQQLSVFHLPLLFVPLLVAVLVYPAFDKYLEHKSFELELRQKTATEILTEELSALLEQLKITPENTALRRDIGSAYFLLGDYSRAQQVLHHKSLQSDEQALALLLRMHYQLAIKDDDSDTPTPTGSDRQTELRQQMQRLRDVNPEHPVLLAVMANEYLAAGNQTAAVRQWRKLLEQQTTDAGREQILELIRAAESSEAPGSFTFN